MKYKKSLIFICLLICLFSIASVCASEIDTSIDSENTSQVGLSDNNKLIGDNLQTSEENEALASTDYDEAIAQTDTEVLGADSATYFDLAEEIGHSGNIKLNHKSYTYDGGKTITISEDNKVIDGNGAVIDMNGSRIRAFTVTASGVTIKNLTIKNANYNGGGGAILFSSSASGYVLNCNFVDNKLIGGYNQGAAIYMYSGTVSNCNFINNKATSSDSNGGAVYFNSNCNVTNCNFAGNTAGRYGGAVYFNSNCNVTNCNFTDNTATGDGGAVYFNSNCNVTNCNFTGNKASHDGGAIHMCSGTVSNCNLNYNSVSNYGGAIYSNTNTIINTNSEIKNCNFTGNKASYDGGAIQISYGSVSNCTFTNNSATGKNSMGGAIHTLVITVTNCNFNNNSASGGGAVYCQSSSKVSNCTFTNNSATGEDSWGGAIRFNCNSGSVANCNFVNNTAKFAGAIRMYSGSVVNCNFVNNSAKGDGGAIYGSSTVSNCNFTGNTANYGGAINKGSGTVSNCNFTGNTATYEGGAVLLFDTSKVINCNFANNSASKYAGAIYIYSGTVTNCKFANNSASQGGAIFSKQENCTADTCIFKSNFGENVNTVILPPTLNADDFNSFCGSGEKLTFDLKTNSSLPITNGNILISIYFKDNDKWAANYTCLSGDGWAVDLPVGSYYAVFNTEYKDFKPINKTIEITMPDVQFYINVTSFTTNNKTVNITAKSDIPKNILWNGKLLFILPNGENITAKLASNRTWWTMYTFDAYDVYQVSATYIGIDEVIVSNGTITINKASTEIKVENSTVNMLVGDSVDSGATLTPADAGNLTYTVSNSSVIKVENGKIIAVGEGSAIITVSFAGNEDYLAADDKTISVTASKIPTEITIENATVELFIGDSIGTGATLKPVNTSSLSFTSNNMSVAKVEDGKIIAVGEGSAIITVSFEGNNDYMPAESKIITVNVKRVAIQIIVDNVAAYPGDNLNIFVNIIAENNVHFNGKVNVTLPEGQATAIDVINGKGNITWMVPENFTVGNYTLPVNYIGDDKYLAAASEGKINILKFDSKVNILPIADIVYGNIALIKYNIENMTNVTVMIEGVSDDKIFFTNDTIIVTGLDVGKYTITIINNETSFYNGSNDTETFTVNSVTTSILAADVSTTYNINKELIITLKDSNGNVLFGVSVTVDLNGAKIYITDKNGQVKVSTKGLAPKLYATKITFNGNANYVKSTKDVKVTVKKATPKLTAKKKTFKKSVKTKKYTVTLKDNQNKAMKNIKVTIKVNKKTYTAKTNAKGKATFKIKKLTKKGKYNAVVTYKGNNLYNKVTKKTKIIVK